MREAAAAAFFLLLLLLLDRVSEADLVGLDCGLAKPLRLLIGAR